MIRSELGEKLGSENLASVIIATTMFDAVSSWSQDVGMSHLHAMSDKTMSPAQAHAAAVSFVGSMYSQAWQAIDSGNTSRAMQFFAYALHTLQDSTSPAHNGFQFWGGLAKPIDATKHYSQENFNPGTNSNLGRITRKAYDWLMNRNLPKDPFKDLEADPNPGNGSTGPTE
jgi:hypothetical protein